MKGKSILVVDDSLVNLMLVGSLLENEGCFIRTATEAEGVLKMLENFHPDMILMDIQLPGMDGLSLTREIKKKPAYQDITIVALTAYAMTGDEERARASGCAGYITKPIDTEGFSETIARFLPDNDAG